VLVFNMISELGEKFLGSEDVSEEFKSPLLVACCGSMKVLLLGTNAGDVYCGLSEAIVEVDETIRLSDDATSEDNVLVLGLIPDGGKEADSSAEGSEVGKFPSVGQEMGDETDLNVTKRLFN
jgi:hypothetical protein